MHLISLPTRPHVYFFVVRSVAVEHFWRTIAAGDHVEGHNAICMVKATSQPKIGQLQLTFVVQKDISTW